MGRRSFIFTVTRVHGNRVTGVAYLRGFMPYHFQDLPFTGVLASN